MRDLPPTPRNATCVAPVRALNIRVLVHLDQAWSAFGTPYLVAIGRNVAVRQHIAVRGEVLI
jgi:hypothetical protein